MGLVGGRVVGIKSIGILQFLTCPCEIPFKKELHKCQPGNCQTARTKLQTLRCRRINYLAEAENS